MDPEIEIINKMTTVEKVKNFIQKNKKFLIIGVCSIIVLVISFFIYIEFKKNKKIELSEKYNSVLIQFKTGQNKEILKKSLIEIINEKDKTYSPLSLYFIIDNNLLDSNEDINKYFDIIISIGSLEKEIKNLILYKKALFNSEFASEDNLLKILNPVINSDSTWKSHSLYLMAEYFFSKNEMQKSREFFEKIANLEISNSNIKLEAQKRLNRDFSE